MTQTRTVTWDVDGEAFEGLLAVPDGDGAHPCVLVCHAWGGRSEHEEAVARRLADMGYAAMAGDVYGQGVSGGSKEENQALMEPLASDRGGKLAARLRAALDALTGQPEADGERAAAAGYCFGGLCVLDMARAGMAVRGVAAFHAILGEDGKPGEGDIAARVLAMQGYDDPMATPDDQRAFTDEMTRRGADWQLHLHGGVMHAFTNEGANDPDFGTVYDAAADRRSWHAFTAFLEEVLA